MLIVTEIVRDIVIGMSLMTSELSLFALWRQLQEFWYGTRC
jgi:hypothetical protein